MDVCRPAWPLCCLPPSRDGQGVAPYAYKYARVRSILSHCHWHPPPDHRLPTPQLNSTSKASLPRDWRLSGGIIARSSHSPTRRRGRASSCRAYPPCEASPNVVRERHRAPPVDFSFVPLPSGLWGSGNAALACTFFFFFFDSDVARFVQLGSSAELLSRHNPSLSPI